MCCQIIFMSNIPRQKVWFNIFQILIYCGLCCWLSWAGFEVRWVYGDWAVADTRHCPQPRLLSLFSRHPGVSSWLTIGLQTDFAQMWKVSKPIWTGPPEFGQCPKEGVFFSERSSLSETLGSSYGWLFNYQNTTLPIKTGWLWFDGEKRNSNDTSLTLDFTSLSPCQLVRVAGEGDVVPRQRSKLGDYRFPLIIL